MGYSVPQMKNEWLKIRVAPADLVQLRSVAETLGLDTSNTIRFLVREKWRELGASNDTTKQAGGKKRLPRAE